jgi:hypothetical protein
VVLRLRDLSYSWDCSMLRATDENRSESCCQGACCATSELGTSNACAAGRLPSPPTDSRNHRQTTHRVARIPLSRVTVDEAGELPA